MFESRYNKVLTAILIIVIVGIVGLLGFLGYDYFQNYVVNKDASEFVDNFDGEVSDSTQDVTEYEGDLDDNPFGEVQYTQQGTTKKGKVTYKGFEVLGTIEIPATNLKYPVLKKPGAKAMETSVTFLFGVGLNQPGNTVISGHNYRNGLFFSNNKKLKIGDKIHITDNDGNKLTYTIYNKFETTPEDVSFYQRDTGGIPELTLTTCTDDSQARLIILAKADQ